MFTLPGLMRKRTKKLKAMGTNKELASEVPKRHEALSMAGLAIYTDKQVRDNTLKAAV
ncbi:hypothetical protein QT397_15770 [Microbulbifer sp. MKSA007]|nr:hypothetical protein QT397_15770 [Microbulbifer sp. MKSA007]